MPKPFRRPIGGAPRICVSRAGVANSSRGVLFQRGQRRPHFLLYLPEIQPGMEKPHPQTIYTSGLTSPRPVDCFYRSPLCGYNPDHMVFQRTTVESSPRCTPGADNECVFSDIASLFPFSFQGYEPSSARLCALIFSQGLSAACFAGF